MGKETVWQLIAVAALGVLGFREFRTPPRVSAQSDRRIFVEPGTFDLPLPKGGNAPGKVFIDLDSGDVWGFRTMGPRIPYPGASVQDPEQLPKLSRPFFLGRFDVSGMRRSSD